MAILEMGQVILEMVRHLGLEPYSYTEPSRFCWLLVGAPKLLPQSSFET